MYALTKEAYRRKIQARLGLAHAQAKLNELKEKNKTSSANPVGEYSNEINELEKNIEETQKRLNELYEAGDEVWEHLDDASERILNALRTAVENAVAKQ